MLFGDMQKMTRQKTAEFMNGDTTLSTPTSSCRLIAFFKSRFSLRLSFTLEFNPKDNVTLLFGFKLNLVSETEY